MRVHAIHEEVDVAIIYLLNFEALLVLWVPTVFYHFEALLE